MNPLIAVARALYGTPGIQPVDVTTVVQGLLDAQYQNGEASPFSLGPISPDLFNIADPSPGNVKTFMITYTLPVNASERAFARGGQDGDTISVKVGPAALRVVRAHYGAETFGLDLTEAMGAYFEDPGNPLSLTIGDGNFFRLFCGGQDPAPGTLKSFSLQSQASPVARIVNFSGLDNETIDFTLDYTPPNQSWMSDLVAATPALANLALREICLPASHDSGSYDLSATFTSDNDVEIMRVLQMVNDGIGVIGSISKFINPADWAVDDIVDVTRQIAIATHSDVLQQLRDGIRCLDLRVCYDETNPSSPFAIYHGLLGVPLASVLSSIDYFVSSLAPRGEIVYVTMDHYLLTPSGGGTFSQKKLQQLAALVWGQLDSNQVFGPQDVPSGVNDLFDCTYSQIINAGTSGGSKVILVAKSLPNPPSGVSKVWATSQYSPPDAGPNSLFGGSFTYTDSAEAMFADQVTKSENAKTAAKPFALYLTLTPQPLTVGLLVASRLRNALLVLAAWVALVPWIGGGAAAALIGVAATLAGYIAGRVAGYSSLEELSGSIFQNSDSTVEAILANRFAGIQHAVPSFIYMDYYENRTQMNSANRTCAQVVETAKSVWESNAS